MIGAGNVATHIARHLYAEGYTISCVYSRTAASAGRLAAELDAPGTSLPGEVPQEADFFIVCVPDREVAGVVKRFSSHEGTWVHTSGALSLDLFQDAQERCGVLYPLQTLSLQYPVDLEKVPFLVEGSSPGVTAAVKVLASHLSSSVHETTAAQRLVFHLAAVFANNFTNHMVHVAQKILDDAGLAEALIHPLLEETFMKMAEMGAAAAQTGPAVRGDQITLEKHLDLLKAYPEWEKLYTFISRDINRTRGH